MMDNSLLRIRNLCRGSFRQLTPLFESFEPSVVRANPRFGDYQCNDAIVLCKKYKGSLGDEFSSPAALSARVAATLRENIMFESVTVSPQGFITMNIAEKHLTTQLQDLIKRGIHYRAETKKRVIVDFSSPNVAKEMHVGHLRSTIIGDSTCRVLEFLGHEVHRVNHIGDWGTQFGMLIQYLLEQHPNFDEQLPPIGDLTKFYKQAKRQFDEDEAFKSNSQQMVVKLQGGDPQALQAWGLICEISRIAFQEVYQRLEIQIEDRGESFYNSMLPSVISMLKEKGLVVESDGALCIFTDVSKVPLMLVKRDGGYGYDSTDMAAIYHRLIDLKGDWLIYITDSGQSDHFKMIFEAARQAGWHRENETRCDHMGFGVVQGDDGKKFKTRAGTSIRLVELLDEAASRASVELERRLEESTEEGEERSNGATEPPVKPESDSQWGQKTPAEQIGYAAVKYFDLKQHRISNYKFSFDRILDPRGNTAIYMLYAYARICAIFRKAQIKAESLNVDALEITEPTERELALLILRFPEMIDAITSDLLLHRLTEYMFDLSERFNQFYQQCRVVGSGNQESRLLLCEITRQMLQTCFSLMGIHALTRI